MAIYAEGCLRRALTENLIDTVDQMIFVVFVIICLWRVYQIIELRDQYRHVLAPGSGNRDTVLGMHSFGFLIAELSTSDWPDTIFDFMEDNLGSEVHEEDEPNDDLYRRKKR